MIFSHRFPPRFRFCPSLPARLAAAASPHRVSVLLHKIKKVLHCTIKYGTLYAWVRMRNTRLCFQGRSVKTLRKYRRRYETSFLCWPSSFPSKGRLRQTGRITVSLSWRVSLPFRIFLVGMLVKWKRNYNHRGDLCWQSWKRTVLIWGYKDLFYSGLADFASWVWEKIDG